MRIKTNKKNQHTHTQKKSQFAQICENPNPQGTFEFVKVQTLTKCRCSPVAGSRSSRSPPSWCAGRTARCTRRSTARPTPTRTPSASFPDPRSRSGPCCCERRARRPLPHRSVRSRCRLFPALSSLGNHNTGVDTCGPELGGVLRPVSHLPRLVCGRLTNIVIALICH